MADYNRNQRGSNRYNDRDWNEDDRNDRNDDRYYSASGNRGYGNMNQDFDEGSSQWQSRYEREDYNRGSGNQGRQYDSSGYGNDQDRGFGRNSESGGYGQGMGGRGGSRNLYDRDYEGINRSGYSRSGTRMGGANYGKYGDRGTEGRGRYGNSGYGSAGYGGNYGSNYGGAYSSDYGGYSGRGDYERPGRDREERTWWDRTTDEVSSWFGDEEAERRRDRDRQMNYRGRGPKNYNRSDDRIKEDVNDRLSDDPFIDATEIDVTVQNAEVTLVGMVNDRSEKRRAEDLAESVSGVKNVENRLRVGRSSESRFPEGNTGTTGSKTESTSTSPVSGAERSKSKTYVTG